MFHLCSVPDLWSRQEVSLPGGFLTEAFHWEAHDFLQHLCFCRLLLKSTADVRRGTIMGNILWITCIGMCNSNITLWFKLFIEGLPSLFNTLRPRQNGRHFADDTFNRIFVNENVRISIEFSLKFVPKGPINNIPALFQIMAWRWPGDKPLSEPMMVTLLTHICVTRPQWVKCIVNNRNMRTSGRHSPQMWHLRSKTLQWTI